MMALWSFELAFPPQRIDPKLAAHARD